MALVKTSFASWSGLFPSPVTFRSIFDMSSEKAGSVVRSRKRTEPSSRRISSNRMLMVSSRPFGFSTGGLAAGGGAGGGGAAPAGAVSPVGAAGPPNNFTMSRWPSLPRSISARGRRKPALATLTLFGQSKSILTRSIRSIVSVGRWASGNRASNLSAQLVPLEVRIVFPSLNATRFLLSPL